MVVRMTGRVMKTGKEDCPYCSRGFWTDRDLRLHIQNYHKFGPKRPSSTNSPIKIN